MKYVKLDQTKPGFDVAAKSMRENVGGIPARKKSGSEAILVLPDDFEVPGGLLVSEFPNREAALKEATDGTYIAPMSALRAFL